MNCQEKKIFWIVFNALLRNWNFDIILAKITRPLPVIVKTIRMNVLKIWKNSRGAQSTQFNSNTGQIHARAPQIVHKCNIWLVRLPEENTIDFVRYLVPDVLCEASYFQNGGGGGGRISFGSAQNSRIFNILYVRKSPRMIIEQRRILSPLSHTQFRLDSGRRSDPARF